MIHVLHNIIMVQGNGYIQRSDMNNILFYYGTVCGRERGARAVLGKAKTFGTLPHRYQQHLLQLIVRLILRQIKLVEAAGKRNGNHDRDDDASLHRAGKNIKWLSRL